MVTLLKLTPRRTKLSILYVSSFVLSFHLFFVNFINSSFLAQYIPETYVGTIYVIGALLGMLALLHVATVLTRMGNYKLLRTLTAIEFLAFMGLAFFGQAWLIIPIFIIYQIIFPIILYNFDIFYERYTDSDANTGVIRGILLTVIHIGVILAPFIAGRLLDATDSYSLVYFAAALVLVPFYFLMRAHNHFEDPHYHKLNIKETLTCIATRPNIRKIFFGQFLVRFFFSWMAIYVPLYLHAHIGFSWTEIGSMTAIILLPYLFLEYPSGVVADRYSGERYLLIVGFMLAMASAFLMPFFPFANFWVWVGILMLGRAGACLIELMTESYFFKRVSSEDNNTISFFRVTRPAALMAGPLAGTLSLLLVDFQYIWFFLSAFLLWGALMAARLDPAEAARQ